jgi:uroporphyrinogen decarboxylase
MQISFTPEFASRLRKDMKLSDAGHDPHSGRNTYALEIALEQDLLLISVGWANSYYNAGDNYIDEWGVGWKTSEYTTKFGPGTYTEIVSHPLASDAAISGYQPPDPNRKELYTESERVLRDFQDEYWIVGVTVCTVFECAWALRGLEQLMMDFILDPYVAHAILDIAHNYHLTAAKRLVELGVDMIWIGDDVGAQSAMMISPDHWRTFFKSRMAEFISSLKAINPNVKVAYHSDGMINPIIPDLIEVGLDVLNPIQPACMNLSEVKKLYGNKLCFWGSIDEQYTLPFGTPAEVRAEVFDRLQTIGADGGLIIGPTHSVQMDTPLENFRAMVDTIRSTPYK